MWRAACENVGRLDGGEWRAFFAHKIDRTCQAIPIYNDPDTI
jgi:hypothetical protein